MAKAKKEAKSASSARRGEQSQTGTELVKLAHEAVEVFQKENPTAFNELVSEFDGKSADLALLGHGRFHARVQKGNVSFEPNVARGAGSTGRGAIAPEVLMAILEGRLTPLEAFFKGDLIARSESANLHLVYNKFVEFSHLALRSKDLQDVLSRFKERYVK